MASSSSNGSLLPFELLESILLRVPAESLARFMLTCKQWYALFKDKSFVYKHLGLVQEHFIRVTCMVQTINPATNAHSSLQLPNEFQGQHKISDMIHCDGLLLCIFNDPQKIAVWNPCFNQVKWIFKDMGSYSFDDFYGIGYNNITSRDNYKILRLYSEPIENTPTGEYDPPLEVYEFKSNSWRTLDNVSLDWSISYSCNGVSVKGNMYWVAESHYNDGAFIQSFDFSTEKFKNICPIPFDSGIYDTIVFSCFREDKLSLLHQVVHEELDQVGDIAVWVTNSVEDMNVSWTKLFSVWRPDLPMLHPHDYPPYPDYFIDENNRINVICSEELVTNETNCVCVNLCIIGEDGFMKKEIERHSLYQNLTDKLGYRYLPSIVPVPK